MKRSYMLMSLLVALFAAPGLVAYVIYLHPAWISSRTNHGQLLQPPPLLHSKHHKEKWQLLYWSPQSCTQDCIQRLDDLARLRLALGRRLYYVDLSLAISTPMVDVPEHIQSLLHKVDANLVSLSQDDAMHLGLQPAIYLVNPQNFVILAYAKDQSVQDIFQDLQKMVHDK